MRSELAKLVLTIIITSLLAFNLAHAYQGSRVPEDKRSVLGLYYSAQEAFDYLKWNADSTLFLDVRDPGEIAESGTPSMIDANVPFKFRTSAKPDIGHKHRGFMVNEKFVQDVDFHRTIKGLSKSDVVILICDCGRRASKAVGRLREAGYNNVVTVVDGFKGWGRNKLPITNELDKARAYIQRH